MESGEKAKLIARVLSDKKAADIEILDIGGITIIADYFVICTGTSVTQVGALTDEVLEKMEAAGERALRVEGAQSAMWVLIDYGSVIVHIFKNEVREFYNLDRLWGDAKRVHYDFLKN